MIGDPSATRLKPPIYIEEEEEGGGREREGGGGDGDAYIIIYT